MAGTVRFLYDDMLDRQSMTVRVTKSNGTNVFTAFYQDDFHVNITNQWTTGDATIVKSLVDAASSLITSRTGKLVAGYAKKKFKQLAESSGASGDTRNLANKVTSLIETGQKYQNSHFFSADDFFKSFKGTTVAFPINLQTTLISDEFNPDKDVYQLLNDIYSISIGGYSAPSELGGFVGIQHAPNNFKSGGYDVRDSISGTVKVQWGDPDKGGYTLDNMLISNVHSTFSKTKVEIRPNVWRPLYIDVQVMLEPAKKYTRTELDRAIFGGSIPKVDPKKFIDKNKGKTKKQIAEEAQAARDKDQAKKDEALASKYAASATLPGETLKVENGVATIIPRNKGVEESDEDYDTYKAESKANTKSLVPTDFPGLRVIKPLPS